METQTFVKFWRRGVFVDEDSNRSVASRDIGALLIPDTAYALEFYDRRVHDDHGVVLSSEPFNWSPRFFIGGRIMTAQEVEREIPDHDILLDNMRINGWDRVIQTRCGHFQPYRDGDIRIDPVRREASDG